MQELLNANKKFKFLITYLIKFDYISIFNLLIFSIFLLQNSVFIRINI